MATWKLLGELERPVMEHLWSSLEPQTVREVHAAMSTRRNLAYTTVLTVLRRLAEKGLVAKHRSDRAYRYAAEHTRDELVAGLMVTALAQAVDAKDRSAARVHFVDRVGREDLRTLQRVLVEAECKSAAPNPHVPQAE